MNFLIEFCLLPLTPDFLIIFFFFLSYLSTSEISGWVITSYILLAE